ncbi:MAG: hypothetical protein IJG84_19425 [Kiritimatiellae bacterium]|nr:hypothetical protein [Kiritimatiellia bacterium]
MRFRHGIVLSAVAVAIAAGAEPTDADRLRESIAAKSGGLLEKPGSSSGLVAFIDTQGEMNGTNVSAAVEVIRGATAKYPIKTLRMEPDAPDALKAKSGADVAVIIVADDRTPALLSAPENRWAVVNVRKLAAGLATDAARAKFYDSRCRKEIIRGFASVAGGLGSSFPGNIMSVVRMEDLDLCEEFIPFDKISEIKRHLRECGVTPARYATYRVACREGWAPAPTNDVQKAIWDKVHALPTEPMKILPETKKVSD